MLAKLDQSAPSTELAGFKYQVQNKFLLVGSEFEEKMDFLLFKMFVFFMAGQTYLGVGGGYL